VLLGADDRLPAEVGQQVGSPYVDSLDASLARLLSLLGLERRQPKPVDLTAYLQTRYGGPGGNPAVEPRRGSPADGRVDPKT
jgi:hypothetical protein